MGFVWISLSYEYHYNRQWILLHRVNYKLLSKQAWVASLVVAHKTQCEHTQGGKRNTQLKWTRALLSTELLHHMILSCHLGSSGNLPFSLIPRLLVRYTHMRVWERDYLPLVLWGHMLCYWCHIMCSIPFQVLCSQCLCIPPVSWCAVVGRTTRHMCGELVMGW